MGVKSRDFQQLLVLLQPTTKKGQCLEKHTSYQRLHHTKAGPWSSDSACFQWDLTDSELGLPALLGPDSLWKCGHRFLLQMETQLVKHLGLYSSRELIWPSEVTVKVIHILETVSTKGSAVCHSCRMNRGRHSMNRWTMRGKLSPVITPEDLPPEETARAPAKSCYHIQQEGLTLPLLTLYLWQHLLVFIWVLIMYLGDKRSIFARNISVDCQGSFFFFTGNGQIFVFSV